MGYTTNFDGVLKIEPQVSEEHAAYINKFAETRRMRRNASACMDFPDPIRQAVGLPIGLEGDYYVGAEGIAGQDRDASILDYNNPAESQPGLWCQWVIDEGRTELGWDGGEKFYNYTDWLNYVIERFLDPWGYKLNGTIHWQGEQPDDIGTLTVTNNEVEEKTHTWETKPDGFPFGPDPYGYEEMYDDDEDDEYESTPPSPDSLAEYIGADMARGILREHLGNDLIIELPRDVGVRLRDALAQLAMHPDDLPNGQDDVVLCREIVDKINEQLNEE